MRRDTSSFKETSWEDYALCYDSLLHLSPYKKMLQGVVLRIPRPCGRLLDAACGTGNLEIEVRQKFNDNEIKIDGLDASKEMLARAKEKHIDLNNANFSFADLNSPITYNDAFFDCVVSVNTLYAIKSPHLLLAEFRRVIRNGGTFILVTPKKGCQNGLILKEHCASQKEDEYWFNAHQSEEREEKLIREAVQDEEVVQKMLRIGMYNRRICQTATFHFFDKDELISLVNNSGFMVTEINETYGRQAHLLTATAT